MSNQPADPDPQPPSATDLDHHVEVGLRWSVIRQLVLAVVGTAGVLAYTRLLTPEEVGTFVFASIIYSGLFLLVRTPIRDAVIYFRATDQPTDSAAFWLLSVAGTAVAALVALMADPIGRFYAVPPAIPLIQGMTAAFVFQAIAVVPAALLLKQFRFATHELLQTAADIILNLGWIILLWWGMGPVGIVIPYIASSFFWAASTWWVAGFRPRPVSDWAVYARIIRYSRSLLGSQLVTYLNRNVDNAAVGRLGEGALGRYSFGENQSAFVVLGIGGPIAQVALPALAAARADAVNFRRILLGMLRLTATLSTPAHLGVIVIAPLFISVFFGAQWLPSTRVFQAYLGFRLVQTLLEVCDAAMSAVGRPDIRFKLDLLLLPFFVAATWLSLRWTGSITGVAWSLAAVRTAVGLAYLAITLRVAQVGPAALARHLFPSLAAALLMSAAVFLAQLTWLPPRVNLSLPQQISALAVHVLLGLGCYIGLLFLFDRAGTWAVARTLWAVVRPGRSRHI